MYKHLLGSATGLAFVALFATTSVAPAPAAVIVRPGYGHTAPQNRSGRSRAANGYTFMTINNANDPTFNQLLGINNAGTICGYFGSGATGHPNKGYCVTPPYAQGNFVDLNYPGSVQTQVVAIDNIGNTAGFWIDGANTNFGFVEWNMVFTSYRNPMTHKGTVNQLLGLNDNGIAAGFYTGGKGVNHGYELNQATGKFTAIVPPGMMNVTAAGIDNAGDVAGFGTAANDNVVSFLLRNGTFSAFTFPNSTNTTAFGMNNKDMIVGSYVDAKGRIPRLRAHAPAEQCEVDLDRRPGGIGTTVVNGVNDLGQLVGFYVDKAGNTDGFLATPK